MSDVFPDQRPKCGETRGAIQTLRDSLQEQPGVEMTKSTSLFGITKSIFKKHHINKLDLYSDVLLVLSKRIITPVSSRL